MAADEHDRPMFRVDQIDHVELFVPDRYQAAAWYRTVLGLTVLDDYEHWAKDPKGPLLISSDGGSTKLALFEGRPQEDRETAGFHLVAFRVSGRDFETFLDRLDQVTLTDHHDRRVTRELAKDHGRAVSIYFNDPFGHRLELTTYEVDGLRLMPLGVPLDAVERDTEPQIEIEAVEAGDLEPLPVSDAPEETVVLWMCHRCDAQIPASDGLICSKCFRSTCAQCACPSADNEPICLSCAEDSAS